MKVEFIKYKRDTWVRLLEPLVIGWLGLVEFVIPAGFESDGCSLPRILWRVFGHPFEYKYLREAVFHDWLYRNQIVTKLQADFWFFQMLGKRGLRFRRWLILFGVLAFGWIPWLQHRKNLKKGGHMRKPTIISPLIVLLFLALALPVLLTGCSALEQKAVGIGSGVDAMKLESAGGVTTGSVLPNLILGGAVSAIGTAPALKDGDQAQVVFVRSRRGSFFGELFGLDTSTESMVYIGAPGETPEATSSRLDAFSKMATSHSQGGASQSQINDETSGATQPEEVSLQE